MKKVLIAIAVLWLLSPITNAFWSKVGQNLNSDEFKESRKEALEESIKRKNEEERVRNEEFDKKVHETSFNLYNKYQDELNAKYNVPTVEQLDEVEHRAISETATIFNISEDKVIEIFSRIEHQKYE